MELHPSFVALITEWYELQQRIEKVHDDLKPLIQKEQELRQKICDTAFLGKGKEGTHTIEMPEGWKLKGVLALDYKVDEKAFAVLPDPVKTVFRAKHEVIMATYRALSEEQRKVVDVVLTIKPKMPTLELNPPDEKKAS